MRSQEELGKLLDELRGLPGENEWVEFKENDARPEEIGEYISALANSAAWAERTFAYVVWGVKDGSHELVGTKFVPAASKVGREELENWLLRLIQPQVHFQFGSLVRDGKAVVILQIAAAASQPVRFRGQEFIRIGSYKKKLKDHPERERRLWSLFARVSFEDGIAMDRISDDNVLKLLDYSAYFKLLQIPLPAEKTQILETLLKDDLIRRETGGKWDVTNLGAALFAERLDDFNFLRRKAIRVILYKGSDRVETEKEWPGHKGYACGFTDLVKFLNERFIPTSERLKGALRREAPKYPPLAVRELVANALIHQDFSVTGAGPMIEIFADRMEITNPGEPLIEPARFLDSPPRSRNERLASLMRRIGICEERGSGIDKVVSQIEAYQLPPPRFDAVHDSTRSILYAEQLLENLSKEDRIRACYLHACLKWVSASYLTNKSLRERFCIKDQNASLASRLIKEAVEAKQIVPFDEDASRKFMKYIPWWAAPPPRN